MSLRGLTGRLVVGGVGIVGIALIAVCIYSPARRKLQEFFDSGYTREILATAEGDLLNNGKIVKVIKYKGPESIFLEVLQPDSGELIARVILPDKHDGLFNLHGRVTRLAIADIDNSGNNVLLVPTFDDQLVPHLNIYRYNVEGKHFEAVKPP
jgi:hypothetical protein